ncbi:acyltransferase domain-containing protein, partial [Streptomyces heilongjiangensis]
MVAVQASEEEVLPLLDGVRVGLAAVNGPRSVVVSGEADAVEVVAGRFRAEGRRVTALRVSHAFHSPLMEPMLAEFRAVAESLTYDAPAIPVVSSLTGTTATPDELGDPEYWVRHVRQTVRFADAVRSLAARGVTRHLELGPDGTLTTLAPASLDQPEATFLVPALRKDRTETLALFTALTGLHAHGATVAWDAVLPGGRRVDLPTYAFQHQRYWLADQGRARAVGGGGVGGTVHGPADGPAPEAEFWNAVESGDLPSLATTLGLAEESLDALVPALSAWRRRRQETSRANRWTYRSHWKPLAPRTAGPLTGRWLLLVPQGTTWDGDAGALVAELTAQGAEVVTLDLPENPERGSLAARFAAVVAEGQVTGVVLLADRTHRADGAHDSGGTDGSLSDTTRGCAMLALALQASADAGVAGRVWAFTRGAVSVGRSDGTVDPAQAAVWGLGRVAALEYPDRWGGLVDLPATLDGRAVRRLVPVLAADPMTAEDQVAVRASGVFGRRLTRLPVVSGDRTTPWCPRGTVLVTGGTGALGARVARWAAEEGARQLVLVSRRGL